MATCSQTGRLWQLPRTQEAESIARELMQRLATAPDHPLTENLYGILIVHTKTGERAVLKGFSGLLPGQFQESDWVPPFTAHAQILLAEIYTLARLDQLKYELIALKQLPERGAYEAVMQQYADQLKQLVDCHRQRKESRDRNRTHYHKTLQGEALAKALSNLKRESQQDSFERRHLKQERNQALAPLAKDIAQAEQHIENLKQQYATLSRQWQIQLQAVYAAERVGREAELELDILTDSIIGVPLNTLCQRPAAKLLHYAAIHQLEPLAMAEFWWGDSESDYQSGQFYTDSPENCKILMNISQLSVLPKTAADIPPLNILYQDKTLIVVEKPAGLLSVPGRRYHQQDSVLSRLRCQLPDSAFLQTVHRLDQATSGLLVLATSPSAHKALGQQFSQRQVRKTYEAILSCPIVLESGTIELPLWSNPDDRPKQSVDATRGKPSVTYFQILQAGDQPRIRFVPHTGRTHQLRVHAAHPQGLNSPILGDSLYGQIGQIERLHLHATSIQFIHPVTQKHLKFTNDAPF
ncbi:MAG: RluA family pseudouridine synthase [Cyanobacteria bacterium P01_H01_bin.105]